MTLVNVNGQIISGNFPGPVKFVERMLKKQMGIISKLELCGLICQQYRAIDNLMAELMRVDPGNRILPGQGDAKARQGQGPGQQ